MRLRIDKNTHIYLLLFGMLPIFFAQPFKNATIVSLGTTIVVGATLLAAFNGFLVRGMKESKDSLRRNDSILVFLIMSAAMSFIYGGRYSYSRIVPLICFLECPILLFSAKQSAKKIRMLIYIMFYVFSLYCIYVYFSPEAYKYMNKYGVTEIDELTLGLPNPNQTAMYLLAVFFVLCIAITEAKKNLTKVPFAFSAVIMLYFIYLTKSRTALVIAGGFVVFLLPVVNKRFSKILVKVSLIVPIVFAGLLIVFKDFFASILFMDEILDTGRVEIFSEALNSLTVSKVFLGNYEQYASHNLHNIFISIFVEYGIITAILFVFFMKHAITKVMFHFSTQNKRRMLASVGFALLMIFSSTEAAFYIGGSIYAGFVFVIYYLCLPTDV